MTRSFLLGALVLSLALITGCGGGGARNAPALGEAGAREIPSNAPIVVSLDTSFSSRATSELRALVDRFPAKDRLYAAIRNELAKQGLDFGADVRPALGPETPVGRFLAKRGAGMHHLAFEVDDVGTELARLSAAGTELVDERPRRGLLGREVAFLHPYATGGVLAELVGRGRP